MRPFLLMGVVSAVLIAACGGSDGAPSSSLTPSVLDSSPTDSGATDSSDQTSPTAGIGSSESPPASDLPTGTESSNDGPSEDPTAAPTSAPANVIELAFTSGFTAGQTSEATIALTGEAADIAAFNFDLVYDETFVSLEPPAANIDALDNAERTFQCAVPPPSGDIDPDPDIGRARLICFSFGGEDAEAPSSPLTVATVQIKALRAGETTISFENVAFFAPDALPVIVAAPAPAQISIEGG